MLSCAEARISNVLQALHLGSHHIDKEILNLFSKFFFIIIFLLIIDHISFVSGDRDQRRSAPGDGVPWVANHSRDFHRARDTVQNQGGGGEVGSPGSGSENDSLHNPVLISHPKQTKQNEKQKVSGEEAKCASPEKTKKEFLLHFKLSHDNAEA